MPDAWKGFKIKSVGDMKTVFVVVRKNRHIPRAPHKQYAVILSQSRRLLWTRLVFT